MKIVVFGATDLTLSILNFLQSKLYHVEAIVTVPETFKINYKPDGVKNSRFVNLHTWGKAANIPVIDYSGSNETIQFMSEKNISADFAIVCGWYHMVPLKLRELFPLGCAGFHASLLPKLRGGAPLNWAILGGLKETGVSFFQLDDGVDNGLLYDQEAFKIEDNDAIGNLIKKSEIATIKMLDRTLPKIQNKTIQLQEQTGKPSYCGQRSPENSKIDWDDSANSILRLIRASSRPYSGAYTFLEGEKITIWHAEVSDEEIYGIPGQVIFVNGNMHIVTSEGALKITEAFCNKDINNLNNRILGI